MAGKENANFIAEVSHELRLPLANVKLLVETLLDGALEDPATARHMLLRTKDEVTRLQNLVSDLLSHEKLQGLRGEIGLARVNVAERVAYVLETTKALAQEKELLISSEIEANLHFQFNPEQLDQVLLNLVENAIKFTPARGKVTIRARGNPHVLEVLDTGIGIAEMEIPKIFQRFYRVDRSKTRGSTGLGLSIVKHIVDLHNATITVKSQPDVGTSFTIELPP